MPNAASYTVPGNPADPEAAALDLIERLPADILHMARSPRCCRTIARCPMLTVRSPGWSG
jgi:hypothetical protein